MAANTTNIAEELLASINTDYTTNVKYLEEKVSVDTVDFDSMTLSQQYHLDTSTCVSGRGKRCKINVNNLYDIFGSYSLDPANVVKANAIAEIEANPVCYAKAGHVMLVMKGTTFKKWLESMKRPRTRPDELMLYVLCVLYQQDCVVYTKWQLWHTVNPKVGHTFNMIEEMCEMKLLYIGENLFGVLRCLPLDRPITPPIVLSDIQNAWIIDRDVSENIHLTITGLTRQREVTPSNTSTAPTSSTQEDHEAGCDVKPIKTDPEGIIPFNVFGDAYADFLAATKEEPSANVAAEASQPPSELQITEVRTLGMYIKLENVTCNSNTCIIDPHCIFHGVHSHATATLQEESTTLPEATNSPISVSPLDTTHKPDTSQEMSTHTDQPPFADVLQEATQESRILLEATPANLHSSRTASIMTGALQEATTPEATDQSGLQDTTSNEPTRRNKYYMCLNPTEDDILYLHHDDIVNTRCSIKLQKLTSSDIADYMSIQSAYKKDNDIPDDFADDIAIDDPNWPRKKPVKKSTRPCNKPSQSRIKAQKIIEANNKHRKRKDYTPMQILPLPEATTSKNVSTAPSLSIAKPPDMENAPIQGQGEHEEPSHCSPKEDSKKSSDTDDTIIYEPPPCKKLKKISAFETVTHGIKLTKKTRMYKCPVCGIKKTSVQSINKHFRRRHKMVTCKKCGKQFNNPGSRDKHMYNHES